MSIGFDYVNARRESRTIGLKTVETIIEARLQEISLVPEGACKSAYAQLTNSTEFADASDEAADAMMRAFQKLRDAA
jgi:phage head maturation protease